MRARTRTLFLILACSLTTGAGAADAAETAETAMPASEVIQGMLDKVGGDAFEQLALLRLVLHEEEITSDGKVHKKQVTAYVSTTELESMRLERDRLILACDGENGWATMNGQLDKRPKTPDMAKGTLHNRLVPMLFPYSLTMDGVSIADVSSGRFEDRPAWRLSVRFGAEFFASPVMNTDWAVYVAKDDYTFLGASFQPPAAYSEAANEGIRYRYLKTQKVGNAELPAQVLLEGLYTNGLENGHTRTVKITAETAGWDRTLFINPEQLEALEEQDDTLEFE